MMNYRRILSAAVVCVALVATSETAKSEIVYNDFFSPDSFTFRNECTGEDVLLELDVHILATLVETSDGTTRFRQSVNAHGWGVGESGAMYRWNRNTHFIETDPTGIAYSQTAKSHTRLIGLGDTPNQSLVVNFKFEVDEFGFITNVYIEDVICQGD